MKDPKNNKSQNLLDFAQHIRDESAQADSFASLPLAELTKYVTTLPMSYAEFLPLHRTKIKKCAIDIWNTVNVRGQNDNANDTSKNEAKVCAFAYLLLETIKKPSGISKPTRKFKTRTKFDDLLPSDLKHFGVGIKVVQRCAFAEDLELAIKIMEVISMRFESILGGSTENNLISLPLSDTVARYKGLRILLEWKRDRLDLAENWLSQLTPLLDEIKTLSITMQEEIIDLIYEIGNSELDKQRVETASRWLQRAKLLLDAVDTSLFGSESGNLRLNILHAYTRALLGLESQEAAAQANCLLAELQRDYSHKLAVMVLQLELLGKASDTNAQAFKATLDYMMNNIHIIENNHKLILHYIHKLVCISAYDALQCLRDYAILRLVPGGYDDFVQQTVIICVWIVTSSLEDNISPLAITAMDVITAIMQAGGKPLSTNVAIASHVLLWKRTEQQGSTECTEHLCNLGLHEMFKQSGSENLGKFERKLVSYYLNASKLDLARAILRQIPTERSSHHLSKLLRYQLALRNGTDSEVQQKLDAIVSHPDPNSHTLLACIGDAIEHGNKADCIRLFQRILNRYLQRSSSEVNILVLLRTIAQLLVSIADQSMMAQDELLTRICSIFKIAARVNSPRNTLEQKSVIEMSLKDCQWFERTGFSIAVEHINAWPSKNVIDILEFIIQIRYPIEISTNRPDLMALKTAQVNTALYLQTMLYMSQARQYELSWTYQDIPRTSYNHRAKPDDHEIQYVLYKNAFEHFTAFRQQYDQQRCKLAGDAEEEFRIRTCVLLPLAFEASLYLNTFSVVDTAGHHLIDEISLFQLIDAGISLEAVPRTYAVMADVVLCSALPSSTPAAHSHGLPLTTATRLLRKLISAMQRSETYDIEQAARWIRCIVQLILDHDQSGDWKPLSRDEGTLVAHDQAKLSLLTSLTEQALILTKNSVNETTCNMRSKLDQDGDATMNEASSSITNDQANYTNGNSEVCSTYPPTELEWLGTVLFNLAIDLYIAGKANIAREWAGKAIEIADCLTLAVPGDDYATASERSVLFAAVLRKKTEFLGWRF